MSTHDCQPTCDCGAELVANSRAIGVDVTATDEPPIVIGPFIPFAKRCRHGVVWYAEPTGEQRVDWAERGVA